MVTPGVQFYTVAVVFSLKSGWERIYAVKLGETEAFIKVGGLFGFTACFFLLWAYIRARQLYRNGQRISKLNSKFCCGKISVEH